MAAAGQDGRVACSVCRTSCNPSLMLSRHGSVFPFVQSPKQAHVQRSSVVSRCTSTSQRRNRRAKPSLPLALKGGWLLTRSMWKGSPFLTVSWRRSKARRSLSVFSVRQVWPTFGRSIAYRLHSFSTEVPFFQRKTMTSY